MHTRLVFLGATALILCACSAMNPDTPASTTKPAAPANPLLAHWSGPFGGVPSWNEGSPERYRQALDAALQERRSEYAAIVANHEAPTFANTFLPIERTGRTYTRVGNMFFVMVNNTSSPEYQALNKEVAPKLAAADDEIYFDAALFKRIETVYQSRAGAGLSAEQVRLVEHTYEDFRHAGATLSAGDKEKLSAINQQLATLFTEFSARLLADEDTWTVL